MRQKSVSFSLGAMLVLLSVFVGACIIVGARRGPVGHEVTVVEQPAESAQAPSMPPADKPHDSVDADRQSHSRIRIEFEPEPDPARNHEKFTRWCPDRADYLVLL